MAVQTVNTYAFCVKRISNMPAISPSTPGIVGLSAYEGEQVTVVATTLANAIATLVSQYGSDLGPYTGGAALVPGALTSLA